MGLQHGDHAALVSSVRASAGSAACQDAQSGVQELEPRGRTSFVAERLPRLDVTVRVTGDVGATSQDLFVSLIVHFAGLVKQLNDRARTVALVVGDVDLLASQ
jgi:hypothetical protein